jgi:hypothetical protein
MSSFNFFIAKYFDTVITVCYTEFLAFLVKVSFVALSPIRSAAVGYILE